MRLRSFIEGLGSIAKAMIKASMPLLAVSFGLALLGGIIGDDGLSVFDVMVSAIKSYALIMGIILVVTLLVYCALAIASSRE